MFFFKMKEIMKINLTIKLLLLYNYNSSDLGENKAKSF